MESRKNVHRSKRAAAIETQREGAGDFQSSLKLSTGAPARPILEAERT